MTLGDGVSGSFLTSGGGEISALPGVESAGKTGKLSIEGICYDKS